MTVAFDFIPQWPDHLGVASIAAFPDVDVATRQLKRRIRTHALHFLDRILKIEQRCDFNDASDGNN